MTVTALKPFNRLQGNATKISRKATGVKAFSRLPNHANPAEGLDSKKAKISSNWSKGF